MRPYDRSIAYDDDAVNMIRHNHKEVRYDLATDLAGPPPFLRNDLTQGIETHLAVNDLPEHAFPVLRADAYEIRAGLCVVIARQADGAAVVLYWVVSHFAVRTPA